MADITIEGPDGRFAAPEGTPIPEGYRRVEPAPSKGLGTVAVDIAKGAVLPTAGQIGGAALGTAVMPGVGTFVGGTLGGMAGEGINQATGITEPSLTNLLLAGAGQGAGSLIGKGAQIVKQGARNLPGVAQWLQGRAMSGIEGAIGKATPPAGDVDAAYSAARASAGSAGTAPPLPELTAKMGTVGGQQAVYAGSSEGQWVKAELQRLTDTLGPGASMTEIINKIDDLGRQVGEKGYGGLKALYGAAMESLESLAGQGNQAAKDLLPALQLARQRHAALSLNEILTAAQAAEQGGATNAPQIFARQYTKARPDLERAFPPAVLEGLDRAAAIASFSPRGSIAGLPQMLLSGGLGGGGYAYGGPVGGAAGAAAGVVAGALYQGLGAALKENLNPVTVGLLGAAYQHALSAGRQPKLPVQTGPLLQSLSR